MIKLVLVALLLLPLPALAFRDEGLSLAEVTGDELPEGAIPIPATPAGGTPWSIFEETTIEFNEDTGQLKAGWSKNTLALEGKSVKIVGFMVPTSSGRVHKEFMFSKLPPSCPFCPAADPNQMMLVSMKKPIAYTENPLILRGTFKRSLDVEGLQTGLMYKLQNAEVAK